MTTDVKGAETLTSFTILLRNSVLGLLIGGTVALFAYCLHSWQREEEEVRKNLLVQSSFLASASQSFFDNLGNGLKPLGQLIESKAVLKRPEASRRLLMEFQRQHPQIMSIAVFSQDGRMLINTAISPGKPLPAVEKDPAYLKRLAADMANAEPYTIGPPEMGDVIKRWRYTIRRVIHDEHGQPRFLLQLSIPLEQKETFLHRLPIPPNSFMGLLRTDGYQQARWPLDEYSGVYGKPSRDLIAQAVRDNPGIESGFTQDDSYLIDRQRTRVGGFSRLARGDMYAYVSAPWTHVWEQWWNHNAAVLMLSLVFLLASSLAAYRIWVREKFHRQELVSQARLDSLTGLPNRAAAEETMQFCIDTAHALKQKFSLLFVDLDHFKDINDSLGHGIGDLLLIKISHLIKSTLHEEGMLSRIGGDEFLIVLPSRDADRAATIAERLIEAFAWPIMVRDHPFQITPSIGIAQYPEHGENIDTLLKHADTAMYEAKAQGRNTFSVYKDKLGKRVLERVGMERMLRQALSENQFQLHYQPIVHMESGHIVGAEALIRWVREDGTTMMPQLFISAAEDSGLIHPLGEWILKTALEQAKSWNDNGHELWVSVNMSPRQFQAPNLVERISATLHEVGIEANKLSIEITETVAMLNPETSFAILEALKEIGVRIALDDFGTGYSSLSYLKRIPSDKIKIDKSFVDGVNQEIDDTVIVNTILALADILEKTVVAEGVETEAQYNALRNLRCELAQGYWISKPLPPDDFDAMLERSRLSAAA